MTRKLVVLLTVVVMLLVVVTPALAHPRGPQSMPANAVGGLHTAAKVVPYDEECQFPVGGVPFHILYQFLLLTDVECPH